MGLSQGHHTCFDSCVCDTLHTPTILEPSSNHECLPSCPQLPTPDSMILHDDAGVEILLSDGHSGAWREGSLTPHPAAQVGVPGLLQWGESHYNRCIEDENSMEDIITSPLPSHLFHFFLIPLITMRMYQPSYLQDQTHQSHLYV